MSVTPERTQATIGMRPRATPIVRWFAAVIGLGGAAISGAVIAAGLVMSAPVRGVIGAPPTDLNAESVTISSASGATLQGWFVAGRPGGGAIVLMHGVHANRLRACDFLRRMSITETVRGPARFFAGRLR